MNLFTKLAILIGALSMQTQANTSEVSLGIFKESSISVSSIHDPHQIDFSAGSSFPNEYAHYEEDWPNNVKNEESQTWTIGYSSTIGPYVRWVEGNKIARLTNPMVHPLDILMENGEGCAGTTYEMKQCRAEILDLWELEYLRVKRLYLAPNKQELSDALDEYTHLYKDYLRDAAMTAGGSNSDNEWYAREIRFVKYQVELLLSVEEMRE